MTPIQQLLLGVGAKEKLYAEDVFSTYLYDGNGTAQGQGHTIVNDIDNTKGGLVWIKNRTQQVSNMLLDTLRVDSNGDTYELKSDQLNAQQGPYPGYNITSFNDNGFKLEGNGGNTNDSSHRYVSWNWKKQKGFFDLVKYTGTGNATTISHELGVVPGCIMIKNLSRGDNWVVYHKGMGVAKDLTLNSSNDANANTTHFNSTAPTASVFSIGTQDPVNKSGDEYIAYLFAGGGSTNAAARSLVCDGSDDSIAVSNSTDFNFGNNDFTIECFIKTTQTGDAAIVNRSVGGATSNSQWILYLSGGEIDFYHTLGTGWEDALQGEIKVNNGQWHHVAVTRTGGKFYLFVDGILEGTQDIGTSSIPDSTRALSVGTQNGSFFFDGQVSNVRIINGTALYTASFNPPTAPLTNVTNTKLLCCQNSSTTTAAVIPSGGSITRYGDISATTSTDSPFDDPGNFIFGDSGKENLIKTGSYTASGNAGMYVNVGFEPQYIMVKNIDRDSTGFFTFDVMRGLPAYETDEVLFADSTGGDTEWGISFFSITPNGFIINTVNNDDTNKDGDRYVYIAVRRPDGYVGKLAETASSVFTIDVGDGNEPTYDSNFIVDMAWHRNPASSSHWMLTSRLSGLTAIELNDRGGETSDSNATYDYNLGIHKNGSSSENAWMWKRHPGGFDAVVYKGNGAGAREIKHGLNKVPEMMLFRRRDNTADTEGYHIGLGQNDGVGPETKSIKWNESDAESITRWNNTLPTSTAFTVSSSLNYNNNEWIAFLFASVTGISKCGYYTGNGSSNGPTISLGFQPRFIIIKSSSHGTNWKVFDTIRGIGKDLSINDNHAQNDDTTWMTLSSTGFQLVDGDTETNGSNRKYIYYAHA
tara:strand:+ start:145 stop:2748 length:2604 start_codon:yes stop_codon:yes gene_type:complete